MDVKEIKILRLSRGLTQVKLAELVGTSSAQISYVERGFQPAAPIMERIVEILTSEDKDKE